jgi:hypothetical protein
VAKQKQKSREIREAEMKDWEEKLVAVYYAASTIAECSSDFLTALHELKKGPVYRRLKDEDPEEKSPYFDILLYSTFPSIRCLVHEFSGVVETAIKLSQTPALENFATLSALSGVPDDQQAWVLKEVLRDYPNNDIERANLIIRSINHYMGVGDILREYSTPEEVSQHLSESLGGCHRP